MGIETAIIAGVTAIAAWGSAIGAGIGAAAVAGLGGSIAAAGVGVSVGGFVGGALAVGGAVAGAFAAEQGIQAAFGGDSIYGKGYNTPKQPGQQSAPQAPQRSESLMAAKATATQQRQSAIAAGGQTSQSGGLGYGMPQQENVGTKLLLGA